MATIKKAQKGAGLTKVTDSIKPARPNYNGYRPPYVPSGKNQSKFDEGIESVKKLYQDGKLKQQRTGGAVKKAQDGYTLNDGADTLFGKAGAMKKTKVKERSTDGNYVTKRVTRTTPTGKSTKTTTRRTVQGFLDGAPRVGDTVYKPNNPSMSQKNGGSTKKKMKNGGSLSALSASNKRDKGIDPKGAFTTVQKKTLAGAKGKASLTKDKQLGATKMAKRGMSMKKK